MNIREKRKNAWERVDKEIKALTAERDLLKKVLSGVLTNAVCLIRCTLYNEDDDCGSDACIELHKEQAREEK